MFVNNFRLPIHGNNKEGHFYFRLYPLVHIDEHQ